MNHWLNAARWLLYDLAAVRRDFPDFDVERSYQDHMHAAKPSLSCRFALSASAFAKKGSGAV
jgi:hypothetical protein